MYASRREGKRSLLANQTGKRYVCATCGTEMLVTKGGDGSLMCCAQPMQLKSAAGAARPASSESTGG